MDKEELYTISDIRDDVKREGEIILDRPMSEEEIEASCKYMLADFTNYLIEQNYYKGDKSPEDIQAYKDYFNEMFLDNLKEYIPYVLDDIQSSKSNIIGTYNRIDECTLYLKSSEGVYTYEHQYLLSGDNVPDGYEVDFYNFAFNGYEVCDRHTIANISSVDDIKQFANENNFTLYADPNDTQNLLVRGSKGIFVISPDLSFEKDDSVKDAPVVIKSSPSKDLPLHYNVGDRVSYHDAESGEEMFGKITKAYNLPTHEACYLIEGAYEPVMGNDVHCLLSKDRSMDDISYEWKYGENDSQVYYGTTVGDNYLLVFANKQQPDLYMGSILSNNKSHPDPAPVIYDKTRNDEQREKQGLSLDCRIYELTYQCVLGSSDPEYMMRKVEYCFEHNIDEVSNEKPYKNKNMDIER